MWPLMPLVVHSRPLALAHHSVGGPRDTHNGRILHCEVEMINNVSRCTLVKDSSTSANKALAAHLLTSAE